VIRRCTLVSVGKPKGWAAEATKDYASRLRRYFPVNVFEVTEEDMNRRSHEDVLSTEGERILKRLPKEAYVISLDREKGKQHPSERLALKLEDLGASGRSHVAFVIGGPLGLSPRQGRPPRTTLPRSKNIPQREIPLVAALSSAACQHISLSLRTREVDMLAS
jgi:23S rRNA (pseudouridine1915-N3)-methyltransferase